MKYAFTFKEISTQQTIRIFADSNSTISEFVENVKILIYDHLESICLNKTFDIVEAGHYNNSNGFAPELADNIETMYDSNVTLEEIYGNTWKTTSFYIRIINSHSY